jgi:catechol 2,3-dioxygenase-like lactoylglutathione lyase family enzyme
MSVTRIHHVQVSVPRGSEDAVRAFYCGILGLAEVEKPDVLKARGGLWLAIDGGPALHFGTEEGRPRRLEVPRRAEVDDLDAVRTRLANAGVHTEDGIPLPGLRRFECRDPSAIA